MRPDDISFGLALSRLANWNQLENDWLRTLALAPDGVFVAGHNGVPCGTASVICYGDKLAWIGMVVVHPDHRGCGIGGALMRHGLQYLHTAGVDCVKLDATDQGRPLYRKLGFQDEKPISRFFLPQWTGTPGSQLPSIAEDDWPGIANLDHEAFGADRIPLLTRLAQDGVTAILKNASGVQGYGFARKGFNASFLGPIVAEDPTGARALAQSLIQRLPIEHGIFWDLLPDHLSARTVAESFGFTAARTLMRMQYGARTIPAQDSSIFGGAGFEFG